RASRNASLSAAGFADLCLEALRSATVVLRIAPGVKRPGLFETAAYGVPQLGWRHHENLWAVAAELVGEDVGIRVVQGQGVAVCRGAATLQEASGGIRPRNHLDGGGAGIPDVFDLPQGNFCLVSGWRREGLTGLLDSRGDASQEEGLRHAVLHGVEVPAALVL